MKVAECLLAALVVSLAAFVAVQTQSQQGNDSAEGSRESPSSRRSRTDRRASGSAFRGACGGG